MDSNSFSSSSFPMVAPVRVRDKVTIGLWLAMCAGMMERAAYYGSIIMTQNYVQNPPSNKSRPGVLGLGQATATQVQFAFSSLNSITPIIGALLADGKWGRHRTILYAFPCWLLGLLIIVTVSFHSETAQKGGLGVLFVSLILMAVGSGGIRVNMNAFIGDQYTEGAMEAFQDKRGRTLQPDSALTLQYIYSSYYWMINIGSLSGIVSTLLESRVGYGVAFTIPLAFIVIGAVIFILSTKIFVKKSATKGNLSRTLAYIRKRLRARWQRSAANNAGDGSRAPEDDDGFSKTMSDTWKACRIFSTFTIAWLCWGQAENNFISQAGQTKTYGISNDMLYFLNPIVLIILIPCFEKWIYPFLRARGAKLDPLTRIFIGYIILTLSMVYAAVFQAIIYSRGPCYSHPRACAASPDGSLPNDISVFAQIPLYVLQSIAEIFGQIAGTEYAYSHAPDSMKSVMQAIAQCFGLIASLLGVAIAPASKDPWLVIVYAALAGALAVTSAVFWWFFMRQQHTDVSSPTVVVTQPTPAADSEKRDMAQETSVVS